MNRSHANTCPAIESQTQYRFAARSFGILLLTALVTVCALARQANAQEVGPNARPQQLGAVVLDERTSADFEKLREKNREKYGGGATLRTDSELEELLRRAQQFAEQDSFRNAALLWQRVLESSNDSLVSPDGETYFSLTMEVERTISRLDQEGLRQYRVTADGEARALIAQAENREEGLNDVFTKFFLSSFGDDAAYELGCLALDRYDFLTAQRMFRKILESYPDPTVSLADVRLRLAVATAHLGDREGAIGILKEIEQQGAIGESLMSMVKTDVESAENQLLDIGGQDSKQWLMDMGRPDRRGAMPSPKIKEGISNLGIIWQFDFPMNLRESAVYTSPFSSDQLGAQEDGVESGSASGMSAVLKRWKDNNWYPKSQVLVRDGLVYFRSNNDIVCWDLTSESDKPKWRSLWLNVYEQDDASRQLAAMNQQYNNQVSKTTQPSSEYEVMMFGDIVCHQMSLIDDTLYAIEGKQLSRYGGGVAQSNTTTTNRGFQYGVMPRRSRTNWLTAYDADSGKLKWHIAPKLPSDRYGVVSTPEGEASSNTTTESGLGFMGSPVPYGQYLIVPISDGGSVWLQSLDHATGEAIWTTYLCDEPTGGAPFWSPVGIAIEGRELYAICGSGVVFAMDASTGAVRFARRYERDGSNSQIGRNFGNQQTVLVAQGWDADQLIPFGNWIVILASDHDKIFAIDRQSGEFAWDAPRELFDDKMRFCIGFVDNRIYCAGPRSVTCYDLAAEGMVRWSERLPETSYGKGMVTRDGVFVPSGSSILQLDLATGKIINTFDVKTKDARPVGNLASDGKQIWTIGLGQITVLGSLERQLELLTQLVEAGNAEAHLERSKIHLDMQAEEESLDDIVAYYNTRAAKGESEIATRRVFRHLKSISADKSHAHYVLRLLTTIGIQTTEADGQDAKLSREAFKESIDFVQSTIRSIRGSVEESDLRLLVLLLAQLEHSSSQLMIEEILNRHADQVDGDLLAQATSEATKSSQPILIEFMSRLGDRRALEVVEAQADEANEQSRLLHARVLANLGDRAALDELTELLIAEKPATRAMAWATLQDFTGEVIAFDPLESDEKRAAQLEAWKTQLAEIRETVSLNRPLGKSIPYFGHLLIVGDNFSRVYELNQDREEIWSANYSNVRDAQGLPNGNRLIVLYGDQRVIELDRDGEEVFTISNFPGPPTSARRLPNGNTLVCCAEPGSRVIEYDSNGKVVWSVSPGPNPVDAQRLVDGKTLVAVQGSRTVNEYDSEGTLGWNMPNRGDIRSAQRLADGNTLIAYGNTGKVTEVAPSKQDVRSSPVFGEATDAERLPNGNTLIATSSGVVELDSKMVEVLWREGEQAPPAGAVDGF